MLNSWILCEKNYTARGLCFALLYGYYCGYIMTIIFSLLLLYGRHVWFLFRTFRVKLFSRVNIFSLFSLDCA